MFEKSLQDLVKGIRANKKDPAPFIAQAITEMKVELKSTDPFVKSAAVRKVTYLQMLGYDMAWASFNIVEVMSQPRFAHKRIGYLAACQTFSQETDVILLCTNLLKKEFGGKSPYEVGLAINCLSNIATKDLSRDLLSDVVTMMQSSRPYIRKKAVLCLYKLFLRYPQGLRLTFTRLKEKTEDPDMSVVSCAVNVICELANKKPENYLSLAPAFFKLLTTSNNNWMLIKVVKLMGSLVAQEPRLARKLLEPLSTIIQNTPAKSLQYECIRTVTLALPFTKRSDGSDARNVPAVVRLCNDQLRTFVNDPDQNLKYLGLVGLVNMMASHPRVVAEHRDLVLACMSDEDLTIRVRALELVTGMVTQRNLMELVTKLVEHAKTTEGTYRDQLISKIIFICSRDKYSYLTDFAWYISVLVDLAHIQGGSATTNHGSEVAMQLLDISARVPDLRPHLVNCMLPLIIDGNLLFGQLRHVMAEVLYAAVWIVGENSACIDASGRCTCVDVLDALLNPHTSNLAAHVQGVYVQVTVSLHGKA
jgi:AP-3 complex subunit delta-1